MNLKITLLLPIIFLLSSCSTEIELVNYIDQTRSLNLSRQETKTQPTEIDPKSEKYSKIIEWAKKNTDGWQSTPASYVSKVTISHGEFRLLYNSSYVVVGYVDKDGKAKQYSRDIKPGDLDFLLD